MDQVTDKGALARQLNVDAYWAPFTSNRRFKSNPNDRTMVAAEGCYFTNANGVKIFDGSSGLWCTPLGHAHPRIVEAVTKQVSALDYAPSFQVASANTIQLTERIADMAPEGLNRVFFTNSGSEAVDTALKIAMGYHRLTGQATRTRFIGREKGYHGVGFGGMSVGGMVANRKMFAPGMVNGVDHLPHTHNLSQMAFSKGQPEWGVHLADELERIVALHDASTISAVIVEPMQGSAAVIVPPIGYLEKLREICTKHGILLIFDEVITGFGRTGWAFAAQRLGVIPDMITFAKAITNGIIPMGGVIAKQEIYEAFMSGPPAAIEFCHGYTYSGHPMAAAAAHASLDVYEEEKLFERVRELEPLLEAEFHSLKGEPNIVDVRNFGLTAAVEFAPSPEGPSTRSLAVFEAGLREGLYMRYSGDSLAFSPPFISTEQQIKDMVSLLRKLIRDVA
ncbi:aspartate aminotransferase family protein [Azorhizobium oxalatiphilum]|uniref:Aspartate aminotransferase family protein n=1 Tax=Azorhizobium oxalatiphilum TaxID=980631 RepID=A0A917F6I0_9HYPH|nr:aspartate aminotransferase family protein [Azorhizobium oxalatiphilum]GGF48474.1 aspartate aminotransferase family protein [Azorhizobium oxalatiphilum]